jgi:hypothetical protein
MTDSITIEKPADIIPAVVERMRHLIRWLERRRADKLYINSAGDIEITAKELDRMTAGLEEWAEALEVAAPRVIEQASTVMPAASCENQSGEGQSKCRNAQGDRASPRRSVSRWTF